MIKIIYFVHGTTTDNASKLCSGWKEAMLNDLGKEQALNLGKDIMCVPNRVDEDSGCNELIKNGAYLVENAFDVLEILNE